MLSSTPEYGRMQVLIASWAVSFAACGPDGAGDDANGTGSTSSTGESGMTAMLDASGTQGEDDTTTAADSPTTQGDEGADAGPKLDVGIPTPGSCGSSDAQAIDLVVMTPSGPFAASSAWWAWDYCCVPAPRLVLGELPELETADFDVLTPHVAVVARDPGGSPGQPYIGEIPVQLRDVDALEFGDPQPGFALLEPLDPELAPDGELPLLSATFAIASDGWSITGTVTAPYCAALELPPCPCE